MLSDIGFGEILAIAIVGLLIFGPDRLPQVAAQAARMLRQFRDQAREAKASIIDAADIDESTLRDLRDLDPRNSLRDLDPRQVLRDGSSEPPRRAGTADSTSVDPRDIV